MKIKPFVTVLIVLAVATSLTLSGQTRNNLTRDHNESVNIYGKFQPKIGEAQKISFKPERYVPRFKTVTFDIEPATSTLPTSIKLKPIKPVSIRIGRQQHSFENYFSGGIGSRISPYAEFLHSSGRRNSYRLDFHFYHLSTFKNIADYLPSPVTATLAELGYKKFFRYHSLEIKGGYRLKTNRYYGLKLSDFPGTSVNENDPALKQAFHLAQFGLSLNSNYKNEDKLAHGLALRSYYYADKHGTSEIHAALDFDVHKAFSVVDVLDYQQLGLEGTVKFYRLTDSLQSGGNDMLFRAMPYFNFKYDFISFKAGLDFAVRYAAAANFHFYPYLHASLNLVPETVTVFAGIDGGLEKNGFRKLTEENPFLSSVPGNYLWTNNKINLFAGFRGNVAGRFGFHLQYRFRKFGDMPFYDYYSFGIVGIPVAPWYKNEFIVTYSSGFSNRFEAGLQYHEGDDFRIWLNGMYDSYTLDNGNIAFFKPRLKVQFGASMIINGKIEPHIELWYVGARTGAVKPQGGPAFNTVQLDPYLDLNARVDYHITGNLSVFLEVTNILNKKYMLFTDYPVGGIEAMAGISYRF